MKETILIVDDTPANLQVLVRFLADSGFRTLVAEDGPSALDQLTRARPDLILLDVTMPELDGFETCRQIKAMPGLSDIPVLFLTARSDISDKLKGFGVGGQDYITKPIQKEEVIARVNAHLTILQQKRQLQVMIDQRERFMCIAAHDLRNLLTVVGGYSELGRTSTDLAQNERAFLRIRDASEHMKAIVDDFLTLNLFQRDRRGALEQFDLQKIIDQVIEQFTYAAQSKKITLCRNLPQGALLALGNLAHTHQILTNYTSNALKHSPPNTQVLFSAQRRADRWRVAVQDQGLGIAPAERDRLFVEFANISNKPTGGETSTGLGLSIVKMLAEAQRGSVGAEFPQSGGSLFWLELLAYLNG